MRCPSCNAENQSTAKFCVECGTAFQIPCVKCGFKNPPTAKFCQECGVGLSAPVQAPVPETSPVQPREVAGERRHLTVLFCDLVGSTGIAAQLDPEEWRETVGGYQHAAAEAITGFGGHVAKYLGDGVMAFFGYPEAHDNDAERAARAGLAILDVIAKLNEQTGQPKLSVRIGIDSGPVVVGAGAGKEADVFGDAPNIAARVQETAASGTVVVTERTHRLISGLFVVEAQSALALKGVERPVQLHRLMKTSDVRGRLQAAAAARGLTPFVGREDELHSLMSRWERAQNGEGQMVLIMGEAGIGKSRLIHRFHEQIAGTPHTWIEAGAGAFFQNSPFYPVTEMLRQLLAWRSDDSKPGEQLAQLETRLSLAGLKPGEAVPLIAPLLNLPLSADYPPSTLSPEQQRRRLLATLVEWVLWAARVQPTVIATEDLHWTDPSTLELIQLLVEQGATSQLLLLYTARPEFSAPWSLRAHHTQITLNRLNANNVRTMIGQIAVQKALSDETIATVVERTGGVPLFVEELTRAVIESGDANLARREIPVTLHDSLMARLDRLGPAKEVIQVGAVIGSEFSYELLRAVYPIAEADLQRVLRNLADAELLYVRGIVPQATYQFKHALIRDAAYEALLKSRRKELHRQVAGALEERLPELVKSGAEIVAHHCTEAGLTEQAVRYWQKAGEGALARSANAEAIAHLTKGLELVVTLPDSSDRISKEIRLLVTLTTPLIATKGYTAPEIEKACDRARKLCQVLEQPVRTFGVLGALCSIYSNRGESHISLELGEQMLQIAESQQNPVLLLWANYNLGWALADRGELISAHSHLERCLELYDPGRDYLRYYVQDPGVASSARLAFLLFALGYPEAALRKGRDAVILGRKLSHPYSLAFALAYLGQLHAERGEYRVAQQLEEEATALAEQHGLVFLATLGTIWRGWSLIGQGLNQEGLQLIQGGLARFSEELPSEERLYQQYLLAAAYNKLRRLEEALALTRELTNLVNQTGKRDMESDLHRLTGELLLLEGEENGTGAEQSFRDAISVARGQRARAYELRASTSLARLLRDTGRGEEARAMLANIYGWFTEGFDTADLKDAKALLEELAARPER
jgi:class 3 adenylate cyclase/ribosomal protein L40E